MTINIILIDDHLILGQGIAQLLASQPQFNFSGFFPNTEDVKPVLQNSSIDVILLDISVPPDNGIVFCKWVKNNHPAIKTLFFSMHFDALIINRAMKAGGNGYITKDVDSQVLYDAINAVVNGQIYYSKNVENLLLNKIPQTISIKDLPILSPREKEVLSCIVEGYTSHEIAEKLFISTKTVDFHRSNLLVKFDCKNVAELTREAVLHGLV
ncbi:LuxR C-terminal-related transcriptional regulator [Emticicia sp. SJ17W-69]|uniref:LuxR C-terminal-related transcriptional regulator n=1 Tax=Emticicia sp. SJ17W-69 TaxID=3421657 RepID=UPI003EB79C6D